MAPAPANCWSRGLLFQTYSGEDTCIFYTILPRMSTEGKSTSMENNAQNDRQLISAIKEAVKKKRLTVDEIVTGCEANGEPVSKSTVRRLLSDGTESARFRLTSIVPVAHYVLSVPEDEILSAIVPETTADPETATLEEIRKMLKFREAQIAEMREDYAERSRERSQEVEFLQKILDAKTTDARRAGELLAGLSLLFAALGVASVGCLVWGLSCNNARTARKGTRFGVIHLDL